jgi:hypothetical protein
VEHGKADLPFRLLAHRNDPSPSLFEWSDGVHVISRFNVLHLVQQLEANAVLWIAARSTHALHLQARCGADNRSLLAVRRTRATMILAKATTPAFASNSYWIVVFKSSERTV